MAENNSAPGRTIMLADDDPFIIELYQSKLIREGFEVIPVKDGEETLEKLDTTEPDMLILDLNMPRLDGLEVLRYIRSHSRLGALPVIVLSNACTENMLSELWKLRPTEVLTKRDTVPNKVMEEVKKAFAAAPEPQAEESCAECVQQKPSALVEAEDLQTIRSCLHRFQESPAGAARADVLLDAYKALQEHLQTLKAADPRTYPAQFGNSLESLFEDLYASPACINPSTCRTLLQSVDALPLALQAAKQKPVYPRRASLTLLFVEDKERRESISQWLDRPHYRLVRVRDDRMAINLAEENLFDFALFDAGSAHAAEKLMKNLIDRSGTAPKYTICLMDPFQIARLKSGFLDDFIDIASRPAIQSEIMLKLAMANINER